MEFLMSIQSLSLILLVVGIALAFSLIRPSGGILAWILLSGALLLQGFRSMLSYVAEHGGVDHITYTIANDWMGLGFWLLVVAAMHMMRQVFAARRRAEVEIRERAAALERLSAKMLSGDEMDKKKLAFGLREGLAQTLATIKLRIERDLAQFAPSTARERRASDKSLASIALLLKTAIEDIRTIAAGLRPSSLDELGLLPTIEWFCREFDRLHPSIDVSAEISVREDDVPVPLKIVIYRVIESAFTTIERDGNTDRIALALQLKDGAITLAIGYTPQDSRYAATGKRNTDSNLQERLAEARERTTLSGGSFTIERTKAGGITLRASWPGIEAEAAPPSVTRARRNIVRAYSASRCAGFTRS